MQGARARLHDHQRHRFPRPPTDGHGVENIREVTGTYQVPCYLDQTGCPPGTQVQPRRRRAARSGSPATRCTARFTCNIPRSAVTRPGRRRLGRRPSGAALDVRARPVRRLHRGPHPNVRQLGNEEGVLTCATDFIGMSEDDVPGGDPGAPGPLEVPAAARPPPAGLPQLHLPGPAVEPARRLRPATRVPVRRPLGDRPEQGVFYYGNSQGGIAGGALTAVEPDITRTVLYVPGMNYSTLLTRSVDFDGLRARSSIPSYPDESERPLLLVDDPDDVGPRRARTATRTT